VTPELPYATREGRDHALQLGVWVFLGSETLLFAGLFALYTAYRAEYRAEFADAIHHNSAAIGTANTLVLIVSSFFVASAIYALRGGRRRACVAMIGVAIALGATFLSLKGIEYGRHFADGIRPGHLHSAALPTHGGQLFFALYYLMTGLHALHVTAGMIVLGWLARRAWRLGRSELELELGGLYWHLVDVVWIFLWPLLYLTG
jgi:cytochrome c oxidase subunit 3